MTVRNEDIEQDYTINLSGSLIEEVDSTLSDDEGFAPFRLYAFGPFNLRGQRIGSKSSYRTFVGNEKK